MKLLNLLIWIFWLNINYSSGLRNVYLEAPEAAERGARVEMRCHYELENEVLYTVKWYRGEREFCRYSPRDVPPLKIFKIPGISVVKSESDAQRLTIAKATSIGQGRYTCEVSAEAPSFQTSMVHAFMHVVDLPPGGPEVYGVRHSYRPGMKLRAECVLKDTQPAANLSFYINREPALSKHVWHRVEVGENKLMKAYSTIQFVVQRHDFKRNRIKVQCRATMYSIYYKSVELSAEEEEIPTTTTTEKPRLRQARVNHIQRDPEPTTTSGGGGGGGGVLRLTCSPISIAISLLGTEMFVRTNIPLVN